MLYFLALFAPPLALLLAKKWIHGLIISPLICVLAVIGLFLFLIPGMVLWLIAVLHAFVVINNRNRPLGHRVLGP